MQHFRQRLGFGFEAVGAPLGFGERTARDIERLARRRMRGFGAHGRDFGLRDGAMRGIESGFEPAEIVTRGAGGIELCQLGLDLGDFAFEFGEALILLARAAFELVAPRRQVGERAGEFAEGFFGRRQHRVGFADARIDGAALVGAGLQVAGERFFLGGEAVERPFGIGRELLLALDIVVELRQPAAEFGEPLARALLLAVERFARNDEPLQGGGRARFILAQRR